MAGRIAYYGNIVKDGLVLDIDAAKVDSYPGSGTIWNDISGFQNNGTLTNGPTFNSSNYGSIVFDGTNDFGTIPNYNLDNTPQLSISMWVYPSVVSGFRWIINKRDNGTADMQWQIAIVDSVLSIAIFSGPSIIGNVTTSITANAWYNVTFTTTGVNGGNLSLYVNNTLAQSTTLTGNRKTGVRDIIIARAAWDTNFAWFNGRIANTLIYNKALSASEVSQNYNATKGRYGL